MVGWVFNEKVEILVVYDGFGALFVERGAAAGAGGRD
jgi:hypothetical protein